MTRSSPMTPKVVDEGGLEPPSGPRDHGYSHVGFAASTGSCVASYTTHASGPELNEPVLLGRDDICCPSNKPSRLSDGKALWGDGGWLRGLDSNQRPPGYEPSKLPLLHPVTSFNTIHSESHFRKGGAPHSLHTAKCRRRGDPEIEEGDGRILRRHGPSPETASRRKEALQAVSWRSDMKP